MSDDLRPYVPRLTPTPERPLQGLTVLVIEDSRFASEAIRLLCLRSGGRIRRADSLAAAHRHLAVYRPSVVIADIGLPDGSGCEIIEELNATTPRVPVLLGTSGDPGAEAGALAAGADGFLPKPVESLAIFQQTILAHLPADTVQAGPRALPADTVLPDPVALQDDLMHAAEIIANAEPGAGPYVAQFLGAVAHSAHDAEMEAAAWQAQDGEDGAIKTLAALVEDRLDMLQTGSAA